MAEPSNPIALVTAAEPTAAYARLARECPLARDPALGLWVAAGEAARAAVLTEPRALVRPAAERVPRALQGSLAGELWDQWARMSDGAEHAERRARSERLLASVAPEQAVSAAAAAAERLLPAAGAEIAAPELDAFIARVPPLAVAIALGITLSEPAPFSDEVRALVAGTSPLADDAARAAGEAAAHGLVARLGPHASATRTVADLAAQLFQSVDATAGWIGNTLVALAREPEQRELFVREPDAIVSFVARVLVADPPVHNTRRFMAAPATIAGAELAAGDAVLVLLAAGAGAPGGSPLPFGAGVHRCPGTELAATIAAEAVRALLARRLPWAALAHPRYRPSLNVRCPWFAAPPV